MNTPILEMLRTIAGSRGTRFCMPGHKGRAAFLDAVVDCYDITEMAGADNLYMPRGAIKNAQELYAAAIGARQSFFLVNGSSTGVHAAVLSVLRPGDKVLAARDLHLSAVNAFILAGVHPVFVHASAQDTELPCVVTPEDIRAAVRAHPDAKAVYVTYPNYYGLCADLNEICAVAHVAGMQVICDGAHTAAFDYSDLLPLSPAVCGCDIWTTSLHKTLPAMNQCAVLSIGENTRIDGDIVQSMLNMLQTTSPSYLLLGSCDYAAAFMREEGKERLATVISLVEDNIRKIEALSGYRCVTKDIPRKTGAVDRDILKLVIDVTDRGISGFGAAERLAKQGIDVETADLSNIVLICTVADRAEDFETLKRALFSLQGANYNIRREETMHQLAEIFGVQPIADMRTAAFSRRWRVPLEKSPGEIAAVCVGAYPPGVPVIMPGQRITWGMVDYLIKLKQRGYVIFGCSDTIEVAVLGE
jgi:arginine/lysine/ornithine decarboxylase